MLRLPQYFAKTEFFEIQSRGCSVAYYVANSPSKLFSYSDSFRWIIRRRSETQNIVRLLQGLDFRDSLDVEVTELERNRDVAVLGKLNV